MFLFCAIAVMSAAAIGYEILLMRLFSIVQWHHFAYMIISLALLGYGVSGTFLALTQHWLLPRFAMAFMSSAILFGVTAIGSFVAAQQVLFNPLEVLWDHRQWFYLLLLYLLFTIPFFFAATCIALSFARFQQHIGRIYRSDLLGAGGGALGIVVALFVLSPVGCLKALGALGVLAAALVSLDRARSHRPWQPLLLLVCTLLVPVVWPDGLLTLRMSDYKGLTQTLRLPDTEVVSERSSPLGFLSVVRSPAVPLRYAPGLSLHNKMEPLPQLGLFTDGDGLSAITRYDGRRATLAYLDFMTSALPYHLRQRPRVLILGAGGGADVLQALYHQAAAIDAVELNPQVVELVQRQHADFAGHVYGATGVRVHVAEARGFVTASRDLYDVIQVALLDSFGAATAGVYALNESYLYTVEALQAYINRLRPGGILAITRWLKLPPRDSLKLFATAVAALERSGATHPQRQLAMIRSWQTVTLLLRRGAFTAEEIAVLQSFCERRAFDTSYYPGMPPAHANRYNVLTEAYLFDGAKTLLSDDRDAFLQRYKYHIAPATDNRPYFFHFFKWRVLPEILALRGQGGLPLLEWGYLLLIAALLQAVIISLGLIVLPLRKLPRSLACGWYRSRIGFYFLALGLAFLFIEIAFMQRFILFLSHPLYAIPVVLCAFLVFAGLGSGYTSRLTQGGEADQHRLQRKQIMRAVIAIVIIALLYLFFLKPLLAWCLWFSIVVKIALTLALIAPLGFCMGMPFPLGLATVAGQMPAMIPWVWGINGCASVISAILATILAIHYGFTVVVGLALVLYGLAALAMRRPLDTSGEASLA